MPTSAGRACAWRLGTSNENGERPEGQVHGESVVVELDTELDAAPRARVATAQALSDWGVPQLADDAKLVASELVTNGLLHAGLPVQLRLVPIENGIRVEVEDRSRIAPVRPVATTDAMTGRGIGLVDALSRRWGVQQLPDGKVVWSELVATTPGEQTEKDDVDVDALLASWNDDDGAEPVYEVELGDVPTDLLLAAKAHVDNLIREFTLASGGEASGSTGRVPAELAELIDTVVHRFGEARQAIKRQAIAAAAKGEPRTRLRVALSLRAVEAGEEYLAALDLADSYARDARLLTLETPPAHRAFRQWYVGALVDQVRRAAKGGPMTKPQTFEQRLLEELAYVAAAQRASARSARLQAVTAQLSGATTAEQISQVVVSAGAAVLAASGGAVVLLDVDTLLVPSAVGYSASVIERLRGQAAGADLPAATAIRTQEAIWLENRSELERKFPAMGEVEPRTAALCAVPLTTPQAVRGALRFSFDHPRLFDADERSFITALAAQTAQALERSELYDAERRARTEAESIAQRLARLQEVTTALTGARTPHEIAQIVVTHAADAVGAVLTTFSILVENESLQLVGVRGLDDETVEQWQTFRLDADVPASEAVRRNEVVVVPTRDELGRRYPALADLPRGDRCLVCVPVSLGQLRLGVMSLSFPAGHGVDSAQLRFLSAIADTCAQALDRASALDRATAATEKLSFLAQASSELGSSLDFKETLARVAQLVVPRLADWCAVQVVEDGRLLTVAVAHADPAKAELARVLQERYPPDPDSRTGAPNVIRTGVSELYRNVSQEQQEAGARDPEHLAMIRQLGLSSALVVPLTGRLGTFGALTLIAAESGRHYDVADLAFAEDLASRAAVAVENAQAYQQQSGQLAAITRVAEAAQQAILAPVPERLGAVRLSAAYVSAAQDALVGGDMYEAIRMPGSVRLLIGDVRGKGLDAVRMTTVVLGHFRSAAVECADLATLSRQVDERLRPHLGDEDFVTALVAELYDDGRCEVVSCGHPPALLARDGELTPVGASDSPPLGLGAVPQPVVVQLRQADRLLLYTDGILEARSPDGVFLEVEHLVAPLTKPGDLAAALEEVLAGLREAVGGRLGDDLALLVAEYDPLSAGA